MQINFDEVLERVKTLMGSDSVYAFAKKLGISQQTADCYINGKRKPSVDFIYRVCRICNCSSDEVLGLPARGSERSVITDLNELRVRADEAKVSLENLSRAIDKVKLEARR